MAKSDPSHSKVELKSAEEISEFAEDIFNTVREPLVALDKNLRVVKANRSFYDFFKVTPEKTIGTLIYELGNNQWDIPKLKELLGTILSEKTTFDNFEVEHVFSTIGKRVMLLNARKIKRGWGKEQIILLAVEDITERRLTEEALSFSESRYHDVFESAKDGILILDSETGKILDANPILVNMLGYTREQFINKTIWEIGVFKDIVPDKVKYLEFQQKGYNRYEHLPLELIDGRRIDIEFVSHVNIAYQQKVTQCNIRDITERKRLEESLKKQKNEFETIFNLVPAQIWYKDTKNNFIRVNRQVCTDLGMSIDKIEGHSAEELFPSFAKKYFKDDLEVLNTRKPKLGIIEQVNSAGGEMRWVHSDKIPVFGNDGEVNGLIAVVQDITERKMAEEAQRNSEARLHTLIQTIPDLIWLKDVNGVYLSCNKMFERFFGASEAEITGKTDFDFIDGELADSFRRNDINAMSAGKPTSNEEWITFADDGHRAFLETIKTPMYDTSSALIGVLGIGRDITARKHAEEKLRESQRKYKELTTLLPQSVFEADLKGIITYANDFASETFGYSKKESLNILNYQMMVVSEERDKIVENANRILNDNKQSSGEYTALRKDGTTFPALVYANPIMRDAMPVGIRGIIVDISEIKKAGQELINAKEKAESANKLKDAFIANISHEIRTPINGMLGMTSLIKDIYQDYIKKEDEELFEGIDSSSKRIIRTVDMILNYSRMQVGEFPLFPKNLDLSDLCMNLVKEYTTIAKIKLLDLTFQNNCANTIVFADESSIAMAVSNLIDNAVKFTHKGFVKMILYRGGNDDIILDVKDTGIGLDEKSLDNIFEPYRQVQMGYGRGYEGIGLGLSLVKKVLVLNGASISVKSKKGEGTTFSINFGKQLGPVKKIIHKAKVADIPPVAEKLKKSIVLLVEDDRINQATIKRFLGDKYTTLTTDSSDEALEILKKEKVDIILMDISINGEKNGLELTKELKASGLFSHIPVIAITAHAFEEDKKNAMDAGCDSFLAKPFTKESLLEIIKVFVNKSI